MAMEIIKEVSANEQLRTRIRFQEKAERDRRAKMNSFWKDGLEQGERRKSIEIAQKMLKLNIADEKTIVELTGLSTEELADLRGGV